MFKRTLLLCLLLIFVLGQPVLARNTAIPLTVLQQAEQPYSLGFRVALFEDTSARLTVAEVARLQALFKPSRQANPVYGSTASAVWCAFRVQNRTASNWYLEIGNPYLYRVDLFQAQPGGNFTQLQVGSARKFGERYVQVTPFILPIRVPPGEQRLYYLRLESNTILRFSLRLATMQQLYESNHRHDLAHGLYYGLMLTIMLYNFFVFISIGDRTYLYYVLYLFFLILNVGYIRGHSLEFLFRHTPALNQANVFTAFSTIAAVFFTHSFLEVKQRAPRLQWLGYFLILLSLIDLLLSVSVDVLVGFRVQTVASVLIVFYVFCLGIYFYRQGFAPARFYLLGFGLLAVGVFIYALKDNGILPSNTFTESGFQVGSALEAIILSFALANKMNVYKREKESIQEQALQQASSYSQQLIQTQEQERKRIAAELHDSVGQSLILMKNRILLLKNHLTSPEKTGNQLETLSENLSHTIQEVRSISYGLRPFQLDLLGLTQSIRSLAEEVAEASQLQLTEEIQFIDGLFLKEWEINIYRIVQECLNNLAKHAGATTARLAVYRNASQVEFRIEDNGTGLLPTASPGQAGFGLLGIQERLKIMAGTIRYEPAVPHGTIIFILIPISNPTHEPA
jgi:signal transduction histidine kinase